MLSQHKMLTSEIQISGGKLQFQERNSVRFLTSTKQTPTGARVTGAGVLGICGAGVTGAGVTGAGVAGAKVDGVNTYVSVPKQGDPEGGVAITFTSVVKDEPLHKSIVFVSVTVTDSPGCSKVTSGDPINETVTPLCVLVRSVRSIADDPVLVMTYVYVTSTMQSESVAGGGMDAHSVLSGPTQVTET